MTDEMGRIIRRGIVRLAMLTVAVFSVVFASGASAATVPIGQTYSGTLACFQAAIVQSSGSAYAVPSGTWSLTSWSTLAGPDGGQMSLMVFRPAGGGSYTVVGESPVQSLTANTLNTFTLASPIAVQGGDLLGMWESGADCILAASGTVGAVSFTPTGTEPSVGATFTPSISLSVSLNISATLVAGAGAAIPQTNSVFLCYSTSQTQPGVWPESQAKALFAQGYWLPYAVKGNVAGGTNVGDFHLVCNRAGTQSVNGSSVGDDGTAMGSAYSGVFGIYPELG